MVDLATGESLPQAAPIGTGGFEFRPRHGQIASLAEREVRIWDPATGELVRSIPHPGELRALAWSRDGRRLAAHRANGEVYLHDLESGQSHVLAGHTEGGWMPRFSPDGRRLVTESGDGTTRLWDTEFGRFLWRTSEGRAIAFSADGNRIAYARAGIGFGVWQLEAPKGLRTFLCEGTRDALVLNHDISADGRWLAALVRGGFHLWDLSEGDSGAFFPHPNLRALTLHPTDPAIVLGLPDRLEVRTLPDLFSATGFDGILNDAPQRSIPLPAGSELRDFTLSADGRTAIVNLQDRFLIVVDLLQERPVVRLKTREAWLYTVGAANNSGAGRFAVSPNGRWILVAYGITAQPSIWDATSGDLVKELEAPSAVGVFSPDGVHVMICGINEYVLFRVGSWEVVRRDPCNGLQGERGHAAFSGDSRMLATSRTRQTVQLAEAATGREIATFEPPLLQSIRSVRLARDGSRMAVSTFNNLIQVWEFNDLRPELAALNLQLESRPPAYPLDWSAPPPASAALILPGLAAVGVAGIAAVFILRRHRRVIWDFVRAEARADQRQRELGQARLELLHGQKMKALGTLAAGIAHDFNNLLSVIRMSNKLIGREAGGNEEVREHVASIEEAVQQGKQIVSSMLGYSRAPGEAPTQRDVGELVDSTVALLSREFLSGIVLTLQIDRGLPPVTITAGRLEQTLLNLIVNAAEAMQCRGRLMVSTRLRQEVVGPLVIAARPATRYVELAVQGTGPGIAPEIRDRIFEPFFTTKAGGNRPGTGLGLSMVYTIAEQEGLGLTLETAPGAGARFAVWIPCDEPAPAQPQSPSVPPP